MINQNGLNTPSPVGQSGSQIYAASNTGTDAYAITLSPVPLSLTTGMVVNFKADVANTGPCTLNINSLGAKTIKKQVSVNLAANDILAGQIVTVVYDGTNFQLNPPPSTGTGSVTSVSGAGLATGTVTTSGSITVTAAVQADQETGTSNSVAVTPGVQKYHPSAAKVWVQVATNGAFAAGYNVSSITDTGTGIATINYTVSFSSGFYMGNVNIMTDLLGTAASTLIANVVNTSFAAGSAQVACVNASSYTGTDPNYYQFIACGDQ